MTDLINSLRTGPGVLRLGADGETRLAFRVQLLDAWETLAVEAPADMPVRVVKERVVEAIMTAVEDPEDYMVKLGGWEVLDENESIAACGATHGSTFLVSGRRRRPVR
ncbi:MAG: hypothetical protein IPK85_26795 [Gemmatimonadetes bacterium]|nr:hypothetical protein [Gemmatimonadota bacterium]